VEINSTLPLATCIVMVVLSFLGISFAAKPKRRPEVVEADAVEADTNRGKLLGWRFMWMARIALMSSFVCVGLMRTQLALLFKFSLGFSESSYGLVVMIMCATTFVVFLGMGKTHAWHYVLSGFLLAQGLLALSMLLILKAVGLWTFFLAAGLTGAGMAFLYGSHLYYGISGAQSRTGRMAVHELTLSLGFLTGSIVGGYLSENFGRYMPYRFGVGVMAAGLIAQSMIWFLSRVSRE